MDPHACFIAWQEALRAGDLTMARHLREDFNAWILRGGFAPRVLVSAQSDLYTQGVHFALVSVLHDRYCTIVDDAGRDHRVHPSILTSTEA